MAYSVTYDEQTGIIESVFEGLVTSDDVIADSRQGLALGRQHGATRFLSDLTRADIRLSGFDVLTMTDAIESEVDTRRFRLALLVPDDDYGQQTVLFFETVFTHRGGAVQAFADRREAVDWLLEREADGGHERDFG